MQVSQKTRYAVRAVVYLALKNKNDRISIQQISDEEDISKRYLELIFAELKKAGIVLSIKGAGGGYCLSEEPGSITVAQIAEIFEGGLDIIDNKEKISPEKIEYTLNKNLWSQISQCVKNKLEDVTIEKIIKDYNENLSDGYTYYI